MTAAATVPDRLLDPDLHGHGDPHPVWQAMRDSTPVHHHPAAEYPAFWSLTRYEDIRAVYRDADAFSSTRGVLLRPARRGADRGGGVTLALTDPPRHKHVRALLAEWFNTRAIRALHDYLRATTATLVERAIDRGRCDFAADVAAPLSLHAICRIMGVPDADHDELLTWTNEAFHAHTSLAAHPAIMAYFSEQVARCRRRPSDSLMSTFANSSVDGAPLTEKEIILNWENLIGATENGRLSLISGMLAFLEHRGEWERLRADRDLMPTAVEEVLRWTSSATHSLRTATRAHVIEGQRISAGDRVVLWLPSANRDERVFDDPHRFDITRNPNRHIALASGEHFCLGSTLARAEISVLLGTLLDRTTGIELDGAVQRVRSLAVNGPEKLPVRLRAT